MVRNTVSFAEVVSTVYGPMILHRLDDAQGVPTFRSGKSIAHDEILLLKKIIGSCDMGPVFIDVGANVGFFTIALAASTDDGAVYSFEPQRIIFDMLCGSVVLNGFTNVFCFNMCVGDKPDRIALPQFDYQKPNRFGSIEFGPTQKELLPQKRQSNPEGQEMVEVTTIDRMKLRRVDLIKIDVEGMEIEVLMGAADTIKQCRPIIFCEYLKCDQKRLESMLKETFEYQVVDAGGYNYLAFPNELTGRMKRLFGTIPGQIPEGFDPASYLEVNPDVKSSGVDPISHYEKYGWREGRPLRC